MAGSTNRFWLASASAITRRTSSGRMKRSSSSSSTSAVSTSSSRQPEPATPALVPEVGEQALLEGGPLLGALREHRSAALGAFVVRLTEDEVEHVQRPLALGREAVATHRAVGDVVGLAFGDAAFDDRVAHLRVGVQHEAAEPAALGALARHLELVDLVAARGDQLADGALDTGLVARRAGVVDGHGAAAARSGDAVGQPRVAHDFPQRHRLDVGQACREDRLARGAGQDDARRAQAVEHAAQLRHRLAVDARLAGPVGRRATAGQQQPGGRREALAQVGVGALDLHRVGRRELAAGEEHGVARRVRPGACRARAN